MNTLAAGRLTASTPADYTLPAVTDRTLARGWLTLALAALIGSGLFSVLLVLAHQERAVPERAEARQVAGCPQPALTDPNHRCREPRRNAPRQIDIHLKGAQVAVVHTD